MCKQLQNNILYLNNSAYGQQLMASRLHYRSQQTGQFLAVAPAGDEKNCICTFNCPGIWHDNIVSDNNSVDKKMEHIFNHMHCCQFGLQRRTTSCLRAPKKILQVHMVPCWTENKQCLIDSYLSGACRSSKGNSKGWKTDFSWRFMVAGRLLSLAWCFFCETSTAVQ